jgi:hypothetical protein
VVTSGSGSVVRLSPAMLRRLVVEQLMVSRSRDLLFDIVLASDDARRDWLSRR